MSQARAQPNQFALPLGIDNLICAANYSESAAVNESVYSSGEPQM